ncbi:hypothetical protein ACO0DA_03405 [Bacillus subtilis]|uniref:hypothetical protein n=1 Tax=Bacillus subtilis group TaxID=653685 RepID=UPI000396CB1A|nr:MULTISPECIES: hypothetical protein [Bacillus subtilis group]ERH59290.1 hypothetical protein O205_01390 [Bacillus amyloliquefaciens EGD-AQ14]MCY7757849.1 hypothetical protein [Bacillus inaquosorum]MCY8731491.1 hypothetical protein [Bacillus inaquosorum]MDP0481944.1 hypothetical protein [Bacillus subtilis]MEC0400858.1 hypothetical protein [Bacillus subtilis]
MGKRFLEKLESYEKEAYEGQCGIDWLTELGENVTIYIRECARTNTRATIGGLEKHIDEVAKKFLYSQ